MNENTRRAAYFDENVAAVVVDGLSINDKDVVREAQRWTTGERGPLTDDPKLLEDADLKEFVVKAVTIGAHALTATGQAHEAQALERMISELGDRAVKSTADASMATENAVASAAKTMSQAAADAQRVFREADTATRNALTESIATVRKDMEAELARLFGGTNPEVTTRFAPLLEKFAADLDRRAAENTSELLNKAAKQFDPTDPTSPMARHTAELADRQQKLTEQIDKQHADLTGRIDDVLTTLKVAEAKSAISKVTPIKGGTYETEMHRILTSIGAGLGDEYSPTGTIAGAIPRSKKGDGVLSIGGAACLVVEMTDSKRDAWMPYLDEAERNRKAQASLGLVRSIDQNAGESIRVLGGRRIVMAFDPDTDDADLLRTVVLLLRTSALAATTRSGTQQIAAAEEKITAALDELGKIDEIKKTAGTIHKSAQKIDSSCTTLSAGIQRLLSEAVAALGGATSTGGAVDDRGAA